MRAKSLCTAGLPDAIEGLRLAPPFKAHLMTHTGVTKALDSSSGGGSATGSSSPRDIHEQHGPPNYVCAAGLRDAVEGSRSLRGIGAHSISSTGGTLGSDAPDVDEAPSEYGSAAPGRPQALLCLHAADSPDDSLHF